MHFEAANLRVESEDQIATLWLDCAEQSANRFTPQLLEDLERALDHLTSGHSPDVLLIRSAKRSGFSPGVDRAWLAELDQPARWTEFAGRGQQVLQRLADPLSEMLTLALIEGPCLGVGLELALACDYRVAKGEPSTRIGFPDGALGMLPCWGGTARLVRLLGVRQALKLLSTANTLSAGQAASLRLVDGVFTPKQARIELRSFLDFLQDHAEKRSLESRRRWYRRLWEDNPLAVSWTLRQAQSRLAGLDEGTRQIQSHLLTTIRAATSSEAEAEAAERAVIAELSESSALQNGLALIDDADQPIKLYPEPINPVPALPKRIGIVGAGDLGSSLACWLALQGREVVVQEVNDETLRQADERIAGRFAELVAPGWVTTSEAEPFNRSIQRTVTWQGFKDCDWVIESAEEDLGVKRGIFHELEDRCQPRAPLTSASTTIRIEAIQAELQRPGRVAGVHFLTPFDDNPIVELVRAPATESETLAALDAWLRGFGKTPVLVSDRPGRIVARLMLAYLSEAVLLVAEGLPPSGIDRRMRRFGMRVGPLKWLDHLGFDRVARLVEDLHIARGDHFAANLLLEPLRNAGWRGEANGEGFYYYRGTRAKENELARMMIWRDFGDDDVISHYIFDPEESLRHGELRLIMRMINEAAACLSDEKAATPATIDLAMALGANWAPYLGGPLRYADRMGLEVVVEQLTRFSERFGPRFEPCVELQRRAEAGETFHGTPTPVVVPLPDRRVQRLAG